MVQPTTRGTFSNLETFLIKFKSQFAINRSYPKTHQYLFQIRKEEGEPLRKYMQRFVDAVHEVPHVNHEIFASIIQQNLLNEQFKRNITGRLTLDLDELLNRAEKYIHQEKTLGVRPTTSGEGKKRIRVTEKGAAGIIGEAMGRRKPPNLNSSHGTTNLIPV